MTFDEHVISNNFKFGVIYQKFGQVSSTGASLSRSDSLFHFCSLFSFSCLSLKSSPMP